LISLRPLLQRVQSRLFGRRGLADVASETRVVCAAAAATRPPAIFDEAQLARVTGCQAETAWEHERGRIFGGAVEHAAAIAYRLDGVLLLDGMLYCRRMRLPQVDERERLLATLPKGAASASASLPSTLAGNKYFGHFLTDDLSTALFGRTLAPVAFTAAAEPRSPHRRHYRAVLSLPDTDLRSARLQVAWVFQDFAMGAHKRERLLQMRLALRASVPAPADDRLVFFRRRSGGVARAPVDEAAIETALVGAGFRVVDVEAMTGAQILASVHGAAIAVGVEGSQMNHAIFGMRDGGAIVALQPPDRFNNVLKDVCDAVGHRYGFVVGSASPGGWSVAADEILRLVGRIRT
jgi:hypothetical protein